MYFKALFRSNFFFFVSIGLFFGGCASSVSNSHNNYSARQYVSRYLVPNQLPAPKTINSVQLYRKGNTNNPPILNLKSAQKLVLSFDELSSLSGQFRITFTHHNQNWGQSNIPEDWYLSGMNELIVGGGTKNQRSSPSYFHYKAEFPNNQLSFKTSGNYMLHVYDFASSVQLFSLPFYVTEDAGEIKSWVETDYNAGQRFAAVDRPFSEFVYPDFIEFPQFDLSFAFVQNRFWGDFKHSKSYDFNESDKAQFHLSSQKAFPANYDFLSLNLRKLSADGKQIVDWQPDLTPPAIILREDVLNFSSDPVSTYTSSFGNPLNKVDARYANVRFRFEDGGRFSKSQGVYLTGDFNQWVLSENNRLRYNEESGFWETSTLIKQGIYTYKYALKAGNEKVDDLTLSDTITRQHQEYIAFVYFKDPEYRYQRLLKTQVFRTR